MVTPTAVDDHQNYVLSINVVCSDRRREKNYARKLQRELDLPICKKRVQQTTCVTESLWHRKFVKDAILHKCHNKQRVLRARRIFFKREK